VAGSGGCFDILKENSTMADLARRSFLKYGAGLGLAAPAVLAGCGALPGSTLADTSSDDGGTPGDSEAAQWPLPYSKLDVETVRKRGHRAFYAGDCCYGAFKAIVESLAEAQGGAFAGIPCDMMRFGKGGVVGFGSLCGALNGASAAINLVLTVEQATPVITELLNWYATEQLPSDISNQYAANHEYLVEEMKTDAELARSISGDVLCHTSVTSWCKTSGDASGSVEREERCARLTGDVAAKAVEMLNALQDQAFTPVLVSPGETAGCTACHKKGEDYAAGQWTQGKMNCTACHVSPVMSPHGQ
jgi:hypothetical protein